MKLSELLNRISLVAEKKGLSTPFICGGVVRDRVLGRNNDLNDVDLTTGDQGIHFLAKECSIALKSPMTSYFVMPDGHARIMIGDFKLDFSSNFNIPDIETILEKINITAPTEMQKEVYSRDFTCNSLLMSLDLKNITDPTGKGIQDIKNKIIKTCLNPEITLGYDNKRVARVIYLSAKLGFAVDDSIVNWIKVHPESIKNCRPQYLTKKLTKAMKYNPQRTVELLDMLGLWKFIPVIPELMPYMTAGRV